MRNSGRKLARRTRIGEDLERANFRTLTIMIPLSYNSNEQGVRKRIELSKLVQTVQEIRRLFSGYSVQSAKGWYRDKITEFPTRLEGKDLRGAVGFSVFPPN